MYLIAGNLKENVTLAALAPKTIHLLYNSLLPARCGREVGPGTCSR